MNSSDPRDPRFEFQHQQILLIYRSIWHLLNAEKTQIKRKRPQWPILKKLQRVLEAIIKFRVEKDNCDSNKASTKWNSWTFLLTYLASFKMQKEKKKDFRLEAKNSFFLSSKAEMQKSDGNWSTLKLITFKSSFTQMFQYLHLILTKSSLPLSF